MGHMVVGLAEQVMPSKLDASNKLLMTTWQSSSYTKSMCGMHETWEDWPDTSLQRREAGW